VNWGGIVVRKRVYMAPALLFMWILGVLFLSSS
jgi:hypothetical protein